MSAQYRVIEIGDTHRAHAPLCPGGILMFGLRVGILTPASSGECENSSGVKSSPVFCGDRAESGWAQGPALLRMAARIWAGTERALPVMAVALVCAHLLLGVSVP